MLLGLVYALSNIDKGGGEEGREEEGRGKREGEGREGKGGGGKKWWDANLEKVHGWGEIIAHNASFFNE